MSNLLYFLLLIILLAVVLDILILRWLGMRNRQRSSSPEDVSIFGRYSPALTWFKATIQGLRRGGLRAPEVDWGKIGKKLKTVVVAHPKMWLYAEIIVIFVWSIVITKPYWTLDPLIVPAGGEYLSAIQTHHLWTNFKRCGVCAFWNGSTRGGAPAFVDPHGSMLHPLVIVTTLIWGVLNGSKIALSLAFFLAGLAQWWLGRLLRVGWIPRLWGALMAVAGGHLSARMDLGAFGVVLSTASCAFILPALIYLALKRTYKSAALLGILLALAAVSGQGYMQVGLLFTLPAMLFLIPGEREQALLFGKRFLLACLVAFLFAAPFLVPFLHFLPNFSKVLDPDFNSAQSFEYIPLNLVIRNPDFHRTDSLEKAAFPVLNGNFIGWTAVVLAVISLFIARNTQERRWVNFLFCAAFLAMWTASAIPLRLLIDHLPSDKLIEILSGVRNPAQIVGLAAPPVLALAAIGLDCLLKANWPKLQFSLMSEKPKTFILNLDLHWLLLIPLLFALSNVRDFSKHWIYTRVQNPAIYDINKTLKQPDLQWVNPPFGDHNYIESAVGMGLKLYTGFRTWDWKGRQYPLPVMEANVSGPPEGMTEYTTVANVTIYQSTSGNEYARVEHPEESNLEPSVCRAQGIGGELSVHCKSDADGTLVVRENSWSGWRASVDGVPVLLERSQWLSVSLPPGEHDISFQYRPWDVWLGIGLSVLGLALVIILWLLDGSVIPSSPAQDQIEMGFQEAQDTKGSNDERVQDKPQSE